MIHKKLQDISIGDIQNLIQTQVQENRTLEYKSEIVGNLDKDKKEFLADVSAFANTEGGDLIYGIRQNGEIIDSDIGIPIADVDVEIQRMENIIREGLSPRCEVSIISIIIPENKYVLILRVKPSFNSPHRVIFQNQNRFYRRNSNGKYEMDVSELRTSFIQGSNLIDKIRGFRTIRLIKIENGDLPVNIQINTGFFVVHLIPLSAILSGDKITSANLKDFKGHRIPLEPLYARGYDTRINLDGVVSYQINSVKNGSYTQLFRDGMIEGFDSQILAPRIMADDDSEELSIPMVAIERQIIRYVENMLLILNNLSTETPIYVFVSFYGVKSRIIRSGDMFQESEQINENKILLPEAIINNFTDSVANELKPIFDIFWNSAGYSRSYGYNEDGALAELR